MNVHSLKIKASLTISLFFIVSQPLFAQTDICIPQFLDGSSGGMRWQTTLVLQNQTMSQMQPMIQLYNTAGQPFSGMMMNRLGTGGMQFPFGSNGQLTLGPINARSMLAYRSPGAGAFQSGFLMIQSQARIQAHTLLHLYDSSGNLVSETSIVPHSQFGVGSFWMNMSGGARLGLALANSSGTNPSSIMLEFFGEDGMTPMGTATLQLGPRTQIARFADEWFAAMAQGTIGFMRVTATSPVCGLALQVRGMTMMQIPIMIEN